MAEILVVSTNLLLQVTPFMMVLSLLTTTLLVPGIVAVGIGLGAAYPDFKSENPAQTVTSFGGLIYMVTCAGFIGSVIVLEAGPVYRIFMSDIQDRSLGRGEWSWIIFSFAAALCLCVLAIAIPMRYGEKRLLAQKNV